MAQPVCFQISKKYCLVALFAASLISFFVFSFLTTETSNPLSSDDMALRNNAFASRNSRNNLKKDTGNKPVDPIKAIRSSVKVDQRHHANKMSVTDGVSDGAKLTTKSSTHSQTFVDFNVHIFYYPWYKTPKTDGNYAHWNHQLLPHWSDKTHTRRRQHEPPGDVGSNFYPELGPYSSSDHQLIDIHMEQISNAGVGVLSISWYPPHHENTNETPVDSLMPLYFDAAAKYGLKIALHIEPFLNRSGENLQEVLKYAISKYGDHPAFYRTLHKGRQLPLVYLYDSYQINAKLWADALKPNGKFTIRGTKFDAIVIGLLVEHNHLRHVIESGLDGFYTYFASNGFSYGCTWHNWPSLATEANNNSLIFIPSIGPGYVDTRVRPWNGKNTKLRLRGKYYKAAFKSAMGVKPKFMSITSFNEWHEGTQVEAAIPKTHKGYTYEDYRPDHPQYYMNLTKHFVGEYHKNRTAIQVIQHDHDNIL